MAKSDDAKTHNQIKAYPRGNAQGGRAIQAVKGSMSDNDGTSRHRTVIRETAEGRAIARTRDGMPMVEVEKQGCEIGVDHGAIDILSAAPLHPDAYKDGKLYFTPFVAAHIAAAEPEDPDRPIVDEIEPPDSVKGAAPVDGAVAKSVSAKLNPEKIDALYAKKVMMQNCPPSVFTGKTRLWVQALYGRHDALNLVSLANTLPSATPALVIAGASQDEEYQTWITTNCGVYLDPVTAEHWMIDVEYDKVNFYPLETAEDCIDELRSFLLDPDFPQADKERVETYILADSAPALSKKQTVRIPATHGSTMGYGWHFNWDGDRCDIVLTTSNDDQDNVSNHYRLTFAKDELGRWSATRTLVEGPAVWRNMRHRHVIALPSWEFGGLEKLGPISGGTGSAPFYAFYTRNELKVCRYSAGTTAVSRAVERREPYYLNPGAPKAIGGDALAYENSVDWSGTFGTMSCGFTQVTGVAGLKGGGGFSQTAATPGDVAVQYTSSTYWTAPISYDNDYPVSVSLATVADGAGGLCDAYAGSGGTSGLSYGVVGPFGPFDGHEANQQIYGTVNYKNFNLSTQKTFAIIAVVPFYDSEAIYLLSSQTDYTTETGTQQTFRSIFFQRQILAETGQIFAEIAQFQSGFDLISGDAPYSVERDPVSSTVSYLVSNHGVRSNVAFPGGSDFLATDLEVVSQLYSTRTSASGNSISAPFNSVAQGLPSNNVDNFVGWA